MKRIKPSCCEQTNQRRIITVAKKPKKKQPDSPLGNYSPTMASALNRLRVAATFAEDGAQLDAIHSAAQAIADLTTAKNQRDTFLAQNAAPKAMASPGGTPVSLDRRELGTILAALRLAQERYENFVDMEHFEDVGALSEFEIDDLCESLNSGEIVRIK